MNRIRITVGSWLGSCGCALAKAAADKFKISEASTEARGKRRLDQEILGLLLYFAAGPVLTLGEKCLPGVANIRK